MEHVEAPNRKRTCDNVGHADRVLMIDETDLSFCGPESTQKHLTLDTTSVQYDSECNICPDNADCATIKYLSPGTALTVTCWTDQGEAVIGDVYVLLLRDFASNDVVYLAYLSLNTRNKQSLSIILSRVNIADKRLCAKEMA